jgi:glycolate oxidase
METRRYSPVNEEVTKELAKIFGPGSVSFEPGKVRTYSRDEVGEQFWERDYLAEAVVFPENTEQVSSLMKLASERLIPVTPRGAGTGLSGGAVPAFGGIVVSFEKMNRILECDPVNLTATVEPGVITADISKAAFSHGLQYAGDPCSGDASFIGGNVAENAGGNKVVKYGSTGANVLGLEVVLPSGEVTWFGGKRRKDVTGLDFVHLVAGSEGTLCVVTKIIVKLVPLPECIVDLLVPFRTMEEAISFVPRILTEGRVTPASVECMNRNSLEIVSRYTGAVLPFQEAGAHLIIQLEGNDPGFLADEYERLGQICLSSGALEVFVADNRNSRDRLWKARKSIAEAVMAFSTRYAKEDVVVPTSEVPELMKAVDEISKKYGLDGVNYGHVGDGNIHVNFLMEEDRPDWKDIIESARIELYEVTARLGGTLSGEHGIGLKRRKYMSLFMDEVQIDLISKVKKAFDPLGIMNPGKIVE